LISLQIKVLFKRLTTVCQRHKKFEGPGKIISAIGTAKSTLPVRFREKGPGTAYSLPLQTSAKKPLHMPE
jgi:hypothetical protein